MLAVAQHTPPACPPPLLNGYPTDRFMRLPEVINTTGLSRSSIYDYISRDAFPSQISLGGKNVAWLASEVNEWMNSRIAARYEESRP